MASPSPTGQSPQRTTCFPCSESTKKDEVESPSVSAPYALARFEFESGRGNEGTKILMVEWDDDEQTNSGSGEWQITWEGMRTVLPAEEKEAGKSSELQPGVEGADKDRNVTEKGGTHRMYFMLLPNVMVPPLVTLTYIPRERDAKEVVWHTNPLPAIFPPELGASARTAGKKGVLHTIWAKQRLRSLQKEIDEEARENTEGVGLAMVVAEKEWIEENFGVQARTPSLPLIVHTQDSHQPSSPSLASPRSPGGSKLSEKLKGLKLGTSEQALSPRSQQSRGGAGMANPLSPESSDVAVSSFAAIKGSRDEQQPLSLSGLAAKPAQKPVEQRLAQEPTRKIAAQAPPASVLQQQQQQQMGSLNSFGGLTGMMSGGSNAAPQEEHEEGLFAMPISPRSPEMTKSPFSFAGQDTQRYLRGVGGKAA